MGFCNPSTTSFGVSYLPKKTKRSLPYTGKRPPFITLFFDLQGGGESEKKRLSAG